MHARVIAYGATAAHTCGGEARTAGLRSQNRGVRGDSPSSRKIRLSATAGLQTRGPSTLSPEPGGSHREGMVDVAARGDRVNAARTGGHVVLCGLNGLGLRALEHLRLAGEQVVVIHRPADARFVMAARSLGARCVEDDYRDVSVMRAAGVADARAIIMAEDDDIGNLHAALSANELNAGLRIVLRMFNQQLGSKIETLFTDASVLSASALAAPSFVAAALEREQRQQVDVVDRTLWAERRQAGDADILATLVAAGGEPTLFPSGGEAVCLVDAHAARSPAGHGPDRGPRRRAAAAWTALRALPGLAGPRLRTLAAALVALITVSTLVFATFQHYDLVTSLYFTVTTVTTTGFGDINLKDAPWALKLFGMGLMLLGAASLAVLYTLITDAIVTARLGRFQGHGAGSLREHVIVCGAGSVGFRVIEQLAAMNVPVASAEIRDDSRLLPMVRRLGVPLMVGDTALPQTLVALNVGRARCVMAVTDDDLTNLQTALNARELNPSTRVVLRLFDPDLAAKVERQFGIAVTRSVSALAAPAVTAAALGRDVLATFSARGRFFIVGRGRVDAASPAAGLSAGQLEARIEARILAVTAAGRTAWRPEGRRRLVPGDELVVVATRRGLVDFLAQTSAPPRTEAGSTAVGQGRGKED